MVWGDKKLFDVFIGKQLRHYLEDKDRMALARRFGITRQEYEAPPNNVKWQLGRGQVALRGPPPRVSHRALLALSQPRMPCAECRFCRARGYPDPDYPDLPDRHDPRCPLLPPPPRRHGHGRGGGEYPYRRSRHRRRRPAHEPFDPETELDDIDMLTEIEDDMESDFGADLDDFGEDFDDYNEDDLDLDDGYTDRTRRSYTRVRPGHHYSSDPRRPRGYPSRGRAHHHHHGGGGGRRIESMYPLSRHPGYGYGGPPPMMMGGGGGGHRSPDRYDGPEVDDMSDITW